MTDENWKFNDIKEDPQGSTDDIVQCLRHPFPIGISTPSTLMKDECCKHWSSNSKPNVVDKYDMTPCMKVNQNNGSIKSSMVMSAGPLSPHVERSRRKRLKRQQPFCLRATLANFSTFCQQTSLHGWQYIAQKNSSSAKHMFWAIVVSMSMATAALFLYNNTMDYLNATVKAIFVGPLITH
jgi:hypothetical protein